VGKSRDLKLPDEIRLVLLCRAVRRAQKKGSSFVEDRRNPDNLEADLDAFLAEWASDRELRQFRSLT